MFFLDFLESMSWILATTSIALLLIIFTISGVILVRRYVGEETLKSHHDVAGFVFSNLGVLYGVLLGFTVVNVQQRFDNIKITAYKEASYLSELYRDAEVFSEENKNEVQGAIKAYAYSVVTEEWEMMAKGEESPSTIEALKDIWKAFYEVKVSTPKEQIWYSESIKNLNSLMNARLARLLGTTELLGPEMWTLLIMGGLVIVTFIWFFAPTSLTSHILMAIILAVSVGFILYLIYALDRAFTGNVMVTPEAMDRVLATFEVKVK